ncbi:hypothetical protein RB195_002419 [Necator americanus]|uniref:G-protein coupled receptors family 1 profile domain-containing protein n=1 Tax=Necator americanus TaxID=51031 RepID=A0ABR1DIX7_NECAM
MIIILTKTPPHMKVYKWIVVNMTATTFFSDFIICFLFDPIPLFPEIACYSRTWLANVSEDASYVLLITIPAVTTLVPMVILFSTRYVKVPLGAAFWNMIISQMVALHSPLNTIAIIVATRHYRRELFRYFRKGLYIFSNGKVNPRPSSSFTKPESTIMTGIRTTNK